MDSDTFRQDADRVAALRAVLADPVLQEALLVIHDSKNIEDAKDDEPEIASVRRLSKLSGRSDVLRELYELATPLNRAERPAEPNFGVDEPPPKDWEPI